MKLYKVLVKTYYFGNQYYHKYVLANNKSQARTLVTEQPSYKRDEDAEIVETEEIDDLTNPTPRVI